MIDKYSDRNKSSKEAKMNKFKSIKYLCPAITVLAFIYLLGVVGGFENGSMTFGALIVNAIITIAVIWASIWATSKL